MINDTYSYFYKNNVMTFNKSGRKTITLGGQLTKDAMLWVLIIFGFFNIIKLTKQSDTGAGWCESNVNAERVTFGFY